MVKQNRKHPTDPNQLGKLLCDIATGEVPRTVDDGKDAAASALGQKGGHARAKSLTSEQRRDIARLAAEARWSKDA
jgi:hypothetical protein